MKRADTDSETDGATLAFYEGEAPVYVGSGAGGTSRHLHGFLGLLRPGCKVLELGCGGGRDSEAMMALGFEVTPTDGTPAMARLAEQRLGVPVRVMRFEELAFNEEFDAVWAHASLLHVPRAALPKTLARVYGALKPGGLHYASYKGGGSEGRDDFRRYYNYVSKDQIVEAYQASGAWDFVDVVEYEGGGYQDTAQGPWVAVTVRKI